MRRRQRSGLGGGRLAGALAAGMMLCVPCGGGPSTGASPIPAHGDPVVLFDGSSLDAFDRYLKSSGLNSDPGHVFAVEHGALHVSGTEMGYLITRRPFRNYYLRAEFRWGTGTFGERRGRTRDSGILYNVVGPQKVWPRSLEFQITEGGTGDIYLTDGAALTDHEGRRAIGPPGSAVMIPRFGKVPIQDVTGFRSPSGEVERPHGAWNVVELVNDGHVVRQYVNGRLVNEGTDPFPADGRILFQSEGAEIFYRRILLFPLR